jgi:hypothetical protein
MSLADEAAAFLARRRRKASVRPPAGFCIERRPIPAKPDRELAERGKRAIGRAIGSPSPALLPLAADLARMLADPKAFPKAVM